MTVQTLRKRQKALLRQLAAIGPFVEGFVVRLPHPSCRHVAHRITFKVRGKTHAVYVPVDLVEEMNLWHRNYKRLKRLTRQISKTSRAILHRYVAEKRGVRSKPKTRKRT